MTCSEKCKVPVGIRGALGCPWTLVGFPAGISNCPSWVAPVQASHAFDADLGMYKHSPSAPYARPHLGRCHDSHWLGRQNPPISTSGEHGLPCQLTSESLLHVRRDWERGGLRGDEFGIGETPLPTPKTPRTGRAVRLSGYRRTSVPRSREKGLSPSTV
mgnify:CR=1 FL=1